MSMRDDDILHDIQRSDPFKTSIKVGVGNFKSIALSNHNNMTDTATPVKKTRTPRGYDSLLKGALSLTLDERADLRDALDKSIKDDADALLKQAEAAKSRLKS